MDQPMEALSETVKTGKAGAYLAVIRPYQWVKNLLVFAPVFFGESLSDFYMLKQAAGAALMFCMVASAGYVFNDWRDREEDRNHPSKRTRPFASGTLNGTDGIFVGVMLLAGLMGISIIVQPDYPLMICIASYFFLSMIYSLYLKKVTLLEIFMVSFFFVMRVLAGGLATGIHISNWLFSTVFFLALLITIAKRKSELITMGTVADGHRASLAQYSVDFLNFFLWAVAGVSLVTYALYTVENDHNLVITILPATYGVVRFIYLTDSGKGGDPIITMLKDAHLLVCTVTFLLFICYKIYG
ncbi:MAG: decaprenyl-phosphate phosphoribosyltransferase [Deltaproteobacteria bacterium]|nr:decaprenyl-phosphate phosphoribosyltransferase [Deltaproteobacteria bacterium]MBW2126129.1 decaprenyl-phosphate phosphoribosyltransferase [Deltaproteobacteria bacterium]RLB20978.1 MAG: decaprenyl-phosphate phosphoribosyltransferase [Deltaproteobacteria bacterium]